MDSCDTRYENIIEQILESPDKFVDYQLRDGELYKYVSVPDQLHDIRFDCKLIPAPKDRSQIIKDHHDEAMHLGVDEPWRGFGSVSFGLEWS